MKAPKGLTIVPLEYRQSHPYPTGKKVMFHDGQYGWIVSRTGLYWDSSAIVWAVEAKDYSETVLRRIENECRRTAQAYDNKAWISASYIQALCRQIRSDIKKMKGINNAV